MSKFQEKMQQGMFEGPIITMILKLSIPILIGNLFNYMNLMVDSYFISMLSPESSAPMTGTGVIYPLFFAVTTIASSIAVGLNIVTGRMIGEKKFEECKSLGISGIVITLLFGIPLIIICFLFGPQLINLLAGNELSAEAATYGLHYLYSLVIGLVVMVLTQVYGGILLGEGLAYVTAIAFMGMAIINIILDPIFMFVLGWGIAGAGIATSISIIFSFVYIIRFVYKGKSRIPLSFDISRFSKPIVKEIIKIGMPQFLMTMSFYVIIIVYNRIIITRFNENAMNAWTLAERINQVLIIPITAIGGATTVFMAQNYGRKNIDRIRKALKVNMIFVFGLCTVIALAYVLLAKFIFSGFTLINEVIDLAIREVLITAFTFGCMAVGWVTGSFFQATDRQFPAVIILYSRVVITIIIGVFMLYVLNWGIDAIFISVAVGNIACALIALIWGRRHLNSINFQTILEE